LVRLKPDTTWSGWSRTPRWSGSSRTLLGPA